MTTPNERDMTDVDVDRLRERGDQPLPLFDPAAAVVEPVDLDEGEES